MEGLSEPDELLQPCTFWCMPPTYPVRDTSTLWDTIHGAGLKWEGSRYFTQERRMCIRVEQPRQRMEEGFQQRGPDFPSVLPSSLCRGKSPRKFQN